MTDKGTKLSKLLKLQNSFGSTSNLVSCLQDKKKYPFVLIVECGIGEFISCDDKCEPCPTGSYKCNRLSQVRTRLQGTRDAVRAFLV